MDTCAPETETPKKSFQQTNKTQKSYFMISEVPNSQKVLSLKIRYYNLKPALPDVLLRKLWTIGKSKNPVLKMEHFLLVYVFETNMSFHGIFLLGVGGVSY
jgi:hypothetical protein